MPCHESPYDPSTMPTKLEHVIYEKKGHVAYVTINQAGSPDCTIGERLLQTLKTGRT